MKLKERFPLLRIGLTVGSLRHIDLHKPILSFTPTIDKHISLVTKGDYFPSRFKPRIYNAFESVLLYSKSNVIVHGLNVRTNTTEDGELDFALSLVSGTKSCILCTLQMSILNIVYIMSYNSNHIILYHINHIKLYYTNHIKLHYIISYYII